MGEIIADGVGTKIQRICPGGHGAAGGRFRLTVDTDDATHIHLIRLGSPTHQFRRTSCACHDTGSHIGEVGLAVVRMVEHGDEHGGNTVEAGNPFLIDTGKGGFC